MGEQPTTAADAGSREDPRKVRSRARLLDAATALLVKGGTEAVTIDAVTRAAKVARATLYRHFDSGTELLAAAFGRLVPPVAAEPEGGDLREQLVSLLTAQAKLIEEAPMQLTAMCWLGMGPGLGDHPDHSDRPELRSLRRHIAEQYRLPFDRIFAGTPARELLGDMDRELALAQLVGPIVFTRLATLPPLGPDACERIVDDFLRARSAAQ
ncbi:TetR/AcrR family transcriptional regulator [Rhodococcus tukisamuensis]|uniref:DNA-binding transcriptional regulator, AcrR family n=1 Tax=Rhodococcus tukisamuensis TaxID=168276 RepID=A0A1G6SBR0_9NOCA|nr:TetR/AcrR family transcriptional regulator [Rhodococcus tukisamuensis]SDD14111.1 DNA-binding transcriptional regulator, AcrR family [Rhodococcus tukisamuensis]